MLRVQHEISLLICHQVSSISQAAKYRQKQEGFPFLFRKENKNVNVSKTSVFLRATYYIDCLSVGFYHCIKSTCHNQLIKIKKFVLAQFQRYQSIVDWPRCFGPQGESVHHGRVKSFTGRGEAPRPTMLSKAHPK